VEADLEFFKSRGINNVRVWANWTLGDAPGATVLNSNGGLLTGRMQKLRDLIDLAEDKDMTVDVTFSWRSFVEDTCSTDCNVSGPGTTCWNNFQTGVSNVAANLRNNQLTDNVFFDLSNEFNFPAQGCDALGTDELEALRNALEPANPPRVHMSTASKTGLDHTVFGEILEAESVEFLSPHFPRDNDWSSDLGIRIDNLRMFIDPLVAPIHIQEGMRRGTAGTGCGEGSNLSQGNEPCTAADFLQASEFAASFGAAGWVFHTDAGFRLDKGRFEAALSDFEKGVLACETLDEIECFVEQMSESRCAPSRLAFDDFEGDAAGGSADELLVNHAAQRGVQKWRTSSNAAVDLCPMNGEPLCDDSPMSTSFATSNPVNSTGTAWVPLVIPPGFDGKVAVEADLTVAAHPFGGGVSLGFLSDEGCEAGGGADCSFAEIGEIWLSQSSTGVYFHAPQGIVGIMDWPNFTPTVRHWRLVYNYKTGVLTQSLNGGPPGTLGPGPIPNPSIRAVGFSITGTSDALEGVDNFTAEVIPRGQ
jgi:hypothetical protein